MALFKSAFRWLCLDGRTRDRVYDIFNLLLICNHDISRGSLEFTASWRLVNGCYKLAYIIYKGIYDYI